MFRDQTGDGLAKNFIAALHAGRVCLHPTDTLPGLTFDPTMSTAQQALARLKGRLVEKPCLGLVATAALARRFFAPLPADWERLLDHLWPGPLSVVWTASPQAPASLVAGDGTIGLRVPELVEEAAWFRYVLERLQMPLPTTSVNRSGEPAQRSFAQAAAFVQPLPGSFVPAWEGLPEAAESLPSTVIRLSDSGGWTVLREGQWPSDQLFERIARLRSADPATVSWS